MADQPQQHKEDFHAKDLSARAYIATAAMQGLLSSISELIGSVDKVGLDKVLNSIPSSAVVIADNLLKELEK